MKKFKKIIYTILLVYLFCYHFAPYNQIDLEVKPYLNSFQVKMWDKCNTHQTNMTWQISIQIEDNIAWFNNEIIGVCHPRLFGFDIKLRKDYWNLANNDGKKQLLYHELLHCYLSLDHKNGTIMSEYTTPFNDRNIEIQLDDFLKDKCGA